MSRPIHLNEHEARVMARLQPGERVQIWRPVKSQPAYPEMRADMRLEMHGREAWFYIGDAPCAADRWVCPYGGPGDRVLCKETWAEVEVDGVTTIVCRPDCNKYDMFDVIDSFGRVRIHCVRKWVPSTRMPSWAVRHQLLIQEVRVMRLHEIPESEVLAAGYQSKFDPQSPDDFASQWDRRNDVDGLRYHENPWAWALTLEVTK